MEHVMLIFCIFIILYLLVFLLAIISLYRRKREKEIEQKKKNELMELFERREKASPSEKIKLNGVILNKLKRLPYLYSFGMILEENSKIGEETIVKIVSRNSYNPLFSSLAEEYQTRGNISKAYYAYLLHYIKPKTEKINEFLNHCILSKSIHCTENALLAFASLGNIDTIINAYCLITKENVVYGYRLVADGLMHFKGSKEKLCQELYQNFDAFNEPLKVGFLKFFRFCRYDVRKELLKRLEKKGLEKEVEIEMIRYFSKVLYDKIEPVIIKRLDTNYYNDFEYDVVMVQTLGSYPSKKTMETLKNCLSNYNYYVRYNAGKSLMQMTDITKITGLTDSFAKDMLEALISQEV